MNGLVLMALSLSLALSRTATTICNVCNEPDCEVTISSSNHASGSWALHFHIATPQSSWGWLGPNCFETSNSGGRIVTCVPDCPSRCSTENFQLKVITLNGYNTTFPLSYQYDETKKVIVVWSAMLTCRNCIKFDVMFVNGWFCPL